MYIFVWRKVILHYSVLKVTGDATLLIFYYFKIIQIKKTLLIAFFLPEISDLFMYLRKSLYAYN